MTDVATRLPYGQHHVDEEDIRTVIEVLQGDWLTGGPMVAEFEQALTDATGARHAVAVASGTAALHLAVGALGVGPGDAVIVPTITFLATANAARYMGAEVVFADVDRQTGLMGAREFEDAYDRASAHGLDAKLVVPVHLAGQCSDPAALGRAAEKRDVTVLEDACHSLGTMCRTNEGEYSVGSCAHAAATTFSFHPVKTIAMGEGGAVTTNDPRMEARLRRLRNHGMTRDESTFQQPAEAFDAQGRVNPWYYEMQELGHNYRASDIHCALGLSQLSRLESRSRRRAELVAKYRGELAHMAPIVTPLQASPGCSPCWHLFVVLVDFAAAGQTRGTVMTELNDRGVGTQVHYIPVHQQTYYRKRYGSFTLPGASGYYERALTLPLFPHMSDSDVRRVVEELASVLSLS